ncbi:hypothetical protein JJB09_07380 [Rhizobium sp. KVB221]|uniref:UrcA family protein n=1 Tax=Rhizobium setariae TaxID=2801340 RepID=A0A936YKD4_9HYPH|nr:hypothetical protein [Rhizobium setariae]MBL0371848.1 hypothetical protein [Rhizobium setariae]
MLPRFLPLAIALAVLPAMSFAAEPAASRYQIVPVSGGFVRLDTVSGALTFCRDEVDDFACRAVDAGGLAGSEPGKQALQQDRTSSAEDFDRALSAIERAMKSFMSIAGEKTKDCTL